ncbi:MAG: PilZ domain-containing protein [Candidatus Hydrogenedentes bacterium]|nr:PilZ domain-containing protein [Candidatus Hydrogenedentota bacterium]
MSYENRRFTRVTVSHPISLTLPDGRTFETKMVDISALGICVTTLQSLSIGAECKIHFQFEDDKHVRAEGKVIRNEGTQMAIEFTGIESDSLDDLRNFIVSHADDPGTTDVEILSHMDLLPPLHG